jgi:hypothetical protein
MLQSPGLFHAPRGAGIVGGMSKPLLILMVAILGVAVMDKTLHAWRDQSSGQAVMAIVYAIGFLAACTQLLNSARQKKPS